MKNIALGLIFIASLFGAISVAFAKNSPCYLAHVSKRSNGLELHFEDGGLFVLVKKINGKDSSPDNRSYRQINGQMNRIYNGELGENGEKKVPSEIVLSQSEEASVLEGVHASCTIKFGKQKGDLGLVITNVIGPPGFEPEVSTSFFSIEDINNQKRRR